MPRRVSSRSDLTELTAGLHKAIRNVLVGLYGEEIAFGLVWIEVMDSTGRVGWIPQVYILEFTPVPSATSTPTATETATPGLTSTLEGTVTITVSPSITPTLGLSPTATP